MALTIPALSFAQTASYFDWFFMSCKPSPPEDLSSPEGRPTLCEQFGSLPADITIPTIPPGPNGTSITLASTVNWGAFNGVVYDKNIQITNGELIMDIPLVFWNCEFKMAGGVVIRTTDDNYFVAVYSRFFSCYDMWKGIEAKGNSQVSLWGCQLEDARVTLQIDDVVPEVNLGSNIFNRNHINIRNGSFQPGGDGTINFPYFADNTFECTSKTVHGYGPGAGGYQWTQYHVLLDHCSAALSGGSAVPNRFYDCTKSEAAIYLNDADLVIQYGDFKRFGNTLDGDKYDYAIYTAYGPTNSGSHIVAKNCTFETEGAQGAILAIRSDLEMTDCTLDGSYLYCVHSYGNTAAEKIKITDNEFNLLTATYVAGVWVERPIASNGKHLEINDNHINQVDAEDHSFFGSDGIYIESGFNVHVADQADILRNTFFFDIPDADGNASGLVGSAIYVNTPSAYDNTKVKGNTVTAAKAFMVDGILFNDQFGVGGEISHNIINGNALEPNNVPGFGSTSIRVLNATTGVTMCDNTVNGSNTGIQMIGNNGQTDFSSNNFGVHKTGLDIIDVAGGIPITGTIGVQIGKGNTWLTAAGSYADKAGKCESSPFSSRFLIEQAYSPGTAYFPTTTLLAPSSGWFFNQNVPSNWCAPMASTPAQPKLSDYDLNIASNSGIFPSHSAGTQWEERRMLLSKLIRYPSLVTSYPAMSGFYSAWLANSPGQFAQMAYQIGEAYAIESADQTNMDLLESQRSSIQGQLIALGANVTLPQVPASNPVLAAAKEALLAQLRPLHTQEVALKALIRQKQVTKLQAAQALNAQLPATTVFEANRRLFNHLAIQLFLNGTLSTTEAAQLAVLTAAGQAQGGLAVEEAKHLLPKCDPSDSRSDRRRGQQDQEGQNLAANKNNLVVAPNPADGLLRIQFDPESTGRITLMDIAGKTWAVQTKALGDEVAIIKTEGIPAGIYILSFRSVNGELLTQKVAIQH